MAGTVRFRPGLGGDLRSPSPRRLPDAPRAAPFGHPPAQAGTAHALAAGGRCHGDACGDEFDGGVSAFVPVTEDVMVRASGPG